MSRSFILFFGNYVKFVTALGALDLISSLFARKTEGAGAFCTVAEDIGFVVLVLALASCRGVKGDDPFQLADGVEEESVLAAALIDLLGHSAEGGEGKNANECN